MIRSLHHTHLEKVVCLGMLRGKKKGGGGVLRWMMRSLGEVVRLIRQETAGEREMERYREGGSERKRREGGSERKRREGRERSEREGVERSERE